MKPFTGVALALLMLARAAAGQDAPVRSDEALYADARAKEKAVKAALSDPDMTPPALLTAVRTVVSDYEAIVRRHPSSTYADDALWFAGWLSADAFKKFHDERERSASRRLWTALGREYPSSKYVKQAAKALADLGEPTGSPVTAAAPSPPPPAVRFTAAAPPAALATVKDIRRTVLPDAVRVTIELDREVAFRDERLAEPARVFVDLPTTRASPDFIDRTIRFESDSDVVRQSRIGRHPNNTTRVVLDVAGISAYSVYPLYSPYRLVIECIRQTPAAPPGAKTAAASIVVQPPPPAVPPPSAPAPLMARAPAPAIGAPLATAAPTLQPPNEEAVTTLISTPVATAAAAPALAPTAANLAGGFSMARQLGLGVSRIVIDPGHGGHDPGATGKGVTEASLVLDVALRLEKLLAKVPDVEVILTRRDDDFVPLQERTALANREGADLFLSIHANASANTRARGLETYFLNFATTGAAAAVAARENASSGQPMAALPDFVKAIALHNKLDESRDFATYVQNAMVQKLRGIDKNLKNLGVKQAPFVVLIGASMPSVLAEISFLTNAQDVRLLRGTGYRQRIAEALFDAIRKYQSSLGSEAKVAQQ
jgi:N-acetylmuramoyl-L-alanine amidase